MKIVKVQLDDQEMAAKEMFESFLDDGHSIMSAVSKLKKYNEYHDWVGSSIFYAWLSDNARGSQMSQWSVWIDNPFTKEWTHEFSGSRDECVRYLDAVSEGSCRLWDLQLRRPKH